MAVRRTRQISLKECYDILQLQKGADLAAVKSAYRRRAFELHPDLHPGDAEASRQFQILNEAYVALSNMLRPQEEARQKAAKAGGKPGKNAEAGPEAKTGEEKQKAAPEEEAKSAAKDKDAERASAAYAEQDVLRDLLNDPFARRVFEDIYSELNRKQESAPEEPKVEPPPREKPERAPEKKPVKKIHLWERGQEKGVKGAVKDWLRKQIDEEQTIKLPAARLAPGRKIRLQIRQGLSDELKAVEVTLPPDFAVGKPVRLRGLGKRVGPWQGDLYLIIHTE